MVKGQKHPYVRRDTRRLRGGKKLIGGHYGYGRDYYSNAAEIADRKLLEQELRDPDMTPFPRKSGRMVRLYLRGKTIIVAALEGDSLGLNRLPRAISTALYRPDF